MKECVFKLNSEPMSELTFGNHKFPAFSGQEGHVNVKASACIKGVGPIPPGSYLIVDRQSGGRLGWLRDAVNERSDWFALYAEDGAIDDEMWCNQVKRGQFRMHPPGPRGISEGCIVISNPEDFKLLSTQLRADGPSDEVDLDIKVWGRVKVL